jgi:hypothetical protein
MKKKRLCKNRMPEPIGILKCRLVPGHKGPCNYKGFFGSTDDVRVCMDIAWTSPKQVQERKRRARESERILRSIR